MPSIINYHARIRSVRVAARNIKDFQRKLSDKRKLGEKNDKVYIMEY